MTRQVLPAAALAAVLLTAGAAMAQDASAPPPGGPGPAPGMQHGGPDGMEGHHGYMAMRRARMAMMTKAAAFHFRRDGAAIDIKCAADEPTRACVDAAGVLIDKLAAVTPK